MREVVLPYLTPPSGSWQVGAWQRLTESGRVPLGARLDHWDYSMPLTLACEVSVDVTRVREAAKLPDADRLTFASYWEASSTGIRRVGHIVHLPATGVARVEPVLELDGSLLGGRLKLIRQVVLTGLNLPRDPLAASRVGSVILTEGPADAHVVVLEGIAARFPTEMADFSSMHIAEPEALWYLDVATGDLDVAALAAMRLYLNAAHPAVIRALDPDDPVGAVVRSTIRWDVARSLIRRALDNPEFVDGWGSFEEESFGEVIQDLVQRYWPGETAQSLRARELAHPARFEYQLQARLRLMTELP